MFNPFERVPYVAATVRRDITLPDEKIVAVWWGIEVSGSFAGIVRTVSLTGQRPRGSRGHDLERARRRPFDMDHPGRPSNARWGNSDCAARSGHRRGYGPHLQRLILMLHFQGQMTCDRILTLLNGVGVVISKRRVVRLLTVNLETFHAEDAEVLAAGLRGSPFVTVDDTGARQAGKACFTTHIGSDRFTAFRTGPGKSRLAFLGRLLGGAASYVINAAAIAYMRAGNLAHDIIDRFGGQALRVFGSHEEWMDHLRALGLTELRVTPDPVRLASEAALWGAIEAEGLLAQAVIVLRRRRPVPRRRPRPVLGSRRAAHPQARSRQRSAAQRHRGRQADGLVVLSPAERLQTRPSFQTRRATERPLRPHLQAPDRLRNSRPFVETPARAQGRTLARPRAAGHPAQHQRLRKRHPRLRHQAQNFRRNRQRKAREARDVMLGPAKTCTKLIIPFFDDLGARLGIPGRAIPTSQPSSGPPRADPARKFAPVTESAPKSMKSLSRVNLCAGPIRSSALFARVRSARRPGPRRLP